MRRDEPFVTIRWYLKVRERTSRPLLSRPGHHILLCGSCLALGVLESSLPTVLILFNFQYLIYSFTGLNFIISGATLLQLSWVDA